MSAIAAPSRYTTLSADESAFVLTHMIRKQKPFFFVRYGDGALECINGKNGRTCDLEHYSQTLGSELLKAWRTLMSGRDVYVGDWLSASFDSRSEHARYADLYAALIASAKPNWLHFETLLLMRESEALIDFYKAVKADTRKKLYMGPAANAAAAKMLGAEFIETPMQNLFAQVDRLTSELLARDFDVLLYGAGMAGNIPAIRCWDRFPERTYVNLGSALDVLFMGRRTRLQQILVGRARHMFRDLLVAS